jgi:uncharacterized membrane protein YdjX (TVP38/TMEM64 family)
MINFVVEWLRSWEELTVYAVIGLATLAIVVQLVPIPRTIVVVTAGGVFGPVAILVIYPSNLAGATAAFLLARYILRDRLVAVLKSRPKLAAMAQAVDHGGWRILALLNIASPMPSMVQNYLFGMTNLSLLRFIATTALFSIPQIVGYTYLGYVGRLVLTDDSVSTLSRVVLIVGTTLLALIFFWILKKARTITENAVA